MEIPTREPSTLRAGDTWAWRRDDLTAYPASAWSLRYRFATAATSFELVATADGEAFTVTVAPAVTAEIDPGLYRWRAYVTDGTARYTVAQGAAEVVPDLEAVPVGAGLDLRTHAQRVLAAIEAVIERRASRDQMSLTIAGRQLSRTPLKDLLMLRDQYRVEAQREADAERLGQGRTRFFVRWARG
jgi:hypothetical protein